MPTYTKTSVGPAGEYIYQRGYRNSPRVGSNGERKGYPPSPYVYRRYERADVGYIISAGSPENHPDYQSAYNQAYKRLASSCNKQCDMMANLLELPGTFDTVSKALASTCTAAKSITAGIRALKHGDPDGAKRAFRKAKRAVGVDDLKKFNDTAAGAVLAVNWALKPVFEDVTNHINSTARISRTGTRISGTGRASRSYVVNYDGVSNPTNWTRVTTICDVRFSGWALLDNPALYQAAATGLVNPLATAWELCPFSFVVDWFANVGDIASSLTDFAGINFVDLCLVEVSRYHNEHHRYGGYTSVDKHIDLVRSIVSGPKPPFLEFSLPFGGPQRFLNQVAFLVTQSSNWRNI